MVPMIFRAKTKTSTNSFDFHQGRRRKPRFPSLINCATVDWYDPWPEDSTNRLGDLTVRSAFLFLGGFWWGESGVFFDFPIIVDKYIIIRIRIPWTTKPFIFRCYKLVITHILGFKTFIFHGFGVQGYICISPSEFPKKFHLASTKHPKYHKTCTPWNSAILYISPLHKSIHHGKLTSYPSTVVF